MSLVEFSCLFFSPKRHIKAWRTRTTSGWFFIMDFSILISPDFIFFTSSMVFLYSVLINNSLSPTITAGLIIFFSWQSSKGESSIRSKGSNMSGSFVILLPVGNLILVSEKPSSDFYVIIVFSESSSVIELMLTISKINSGSLSFFSNFRSVSFFWNSVLLCYKDWSIFISIPSLLTSPTFFVFLPKLALYSLSELIRKTS